MRHEAGVEIETMRAPTWAQPSTHKTRRDWREVDRALRTIAQRRAALDADEARWLREAEALQIWRPLGMVSALDYMERVLGYSPRTAQERLRVARALGALPQLASALAGGELPFSAVRELTRVATPTTEAAWRHAATGLNLRDIEELVADHAPGDHPDDPRTPQVRARVVRFELSPETFATLRQARVVLEDEHGRHLDDDAFVAALARTALAGGTGAGEPTGRATYQLAVTVCERCRQGWQHGAGIKVAIGAAAVERAECDAQHIGSIDHSSTDGATPERAYQDVPPAVVRLVWRRDGGRCRTPGCRSARGLEIHHLVRRADGGSHDARNCCLLCSSCHQAHHEGRLTITGTADQLVVRRIDDVLSANVDSAHVGACTAASTDHADDGPSANVDRADASTAPTQRAHVGAPTVDPTSVRAEAKDALVGLGWNPTSARAAVDAALDELGPDTRLDRLIFEALRRCPKPVRGS